MGHEPRQHEHGNERYFRVILEGIDADTETPDSYALKLSTRMHVSFPRARAALSQLPVVVKRNVTSAQAKRLQGILEELGGRVRIEPQAVPAARATAGRDGAVSPATAGTSTVGFDARSWPGLSTCPECGWRVEPGATHCAVCLRKFRDPSARPASLRERLPDENPLDDEWDPYASRRRVVWGGATRHFLLFLAGAVVVLAVFLLAK